MANTRISQKEAKYIDSYIDEMIENSDFLAALLSQNSAESDKVWDSQTDIKASPILEAYFATLDQGLILCPTYTLHDELTDKRLKSFLKTLRINTEFQQLVSSHIVGMYEQLCASNAMGDASLAPSLWEMSNKWCEALAEAASQARVTPSSVLKNPNRYARSDEQLSAAQKACSWSARAGLLYKVHLVPNANENPRAGKFQKLRISKPALKNLDLKYRCSRPGPTVSTVTLQLTAGLLNRLLLPGHPEVDGTSEAKEGGQRIISEEIPLSKQHPVFDESIADLIRLLEEVKAGNLSGLGGILIACLLTFEIDAKPPNIIPNINNVLIKVDNDMTFFPLDAEQNARDFPFKITEELLNALPGLPDDFATFNWLGSRIDGLDMNPQGKLRIKHLLADIKKSPQFQNGINGVNPTRLRALLISEELLVAAVQSCTDKRVEAAAVQTLVFRQFKQLNATALENPSFRAYLLSDQAERDCAAFCAELSVFKTPNESLLVEQLPHAGINYISELRERFSGIRIAAKEVESALERELEEKMGVEAQVLVQFSYNNADFLIKSLHFDPGVAAWFEDTVEEEDKENFGKIMSKLGFLLGEGLEFHGLAPDDPIDADTLQQLLKKDSFKLFAYKHCNNFSRQEMKFLSQMMAAWLEYQPNKAAAPQVTPPDSPRGADTQYVLLTLGLKNGEHKSTEKPSYSVLELFPEKPSTDVESQLEETLDAQEPKYFYYRTVIDNAPDIADTDSDRESANPTPSMFELDGISASSNSSRSPSPL